VRPRITVVAGVSAAVAAIAVALVVAPGMVGAQGPGPITAATVVPRDGTVAPRPLQPGTVLPPTETYVPSPGATTPVATIVARATTPAPPVPADADRPILRVVKTHVDPGSLAPGQDFTVRIDVENVGRRDAEHVQLSLGGTAFLPLDRGAVLYKEEIDAGETRPFETRMRVDSGAASGVFALSLALRWEDGDGNPFADQTSLGIQVVAASKTRPVLAVSVGAVPARCVPGVPFDVAVTLTNTGGSEARNVAVVPAAGPLSPRGGDAPPVTIAPGASATVDLALMATDAAPPGANAQTLEVRYDDPDGQRYTDTTVVGISVAGDAAMGPVPMVTGYRVVGPGATAREAPAGADNVLHPGEVFELQIEVRNVGARDAVSARLALGGGASAAGTTGTSGASGGSASLGVFAPLETSNVRFLGRLAAGASQTVRQRMVVDGAAKAGVYVLEVQFAFADPDGVGGTSSEVISLLVSRRVSLEINPVSVVTSTIVGSEVPFGIEIVNAGDTKVVVGNAEVVAEGKVDVTDGTVFVGPVDGGSVFPVDATLVGRAPGKAKIKVVVHYTDDFGQAQTIEKPFDLLVEAEPAPPPGAVVPVEDRGGGNVGLRILKGLLGLGASAPQPALMPGAIGAPAVIIEGSRGGPGGGSGTVRMAPAPAVRSKP
jgi:hypothetical protein